MTTRPQYSTTEAGNTTMDGRGVSNVMDTDTIDNVMMGIGAGVGELAARQVGLLGALDTPPGGPAAGDRYLVIATATGVWVGQENNIAVYVDTSTPAWEFIVPETGAVIAYFVSGDPIAKVFNGTSWENLIHDIPTREIMVIRDEKTAGTDGGTFTSGARRTRDLTTVQSNTITGASLASNQITLPAGTYQIQASAPAFSVNYHWAILYNITDSADILIGASGYANSFVSNTSDITGVFTLAATKVVELQHRCTVTHATFGFGLAHGVDAEVYSTVTIEKL